MPATDWRILITPEDLSRTLREDVLTGLASRPKRLPARWFYDVRGSELFEQITRLPEYYPTRAERGILQRYAADIARVTGAKTLIELGSGLSEKTRLLLTALHAAGTLSEFVPLDVSRSALRLAADALAADCPWLRVQPIVGDFTRHLDALPRGGTRLVAFLGGTVGNLLPSERAAFLAALRRNLEPGEWLLLGTDLVKNRRTLLRAYDDAAGVTAEFNRNVLHVLNRELGADFPAGDFTHVVVWDVEAEWIEMRLRATRQVDVDIPAVATRASFAPGEELCTEISAKFRRAGVDNELLSAGFAMRHWWTDPEDRYAVSLSVAV